jgi:hypothetical protein
LGPGIYLNERETPISLKKLSSFKLEPETLVVAPIEPDKKKTNRAPFLTE